MKRPFRRNNGIYYDVSTVDGKTTWQSLHTKDPVVAQQRFEALRRERLPRRARRLSDFFEEFLLIRQGDYSKKTVVLYRWCFKDFTRIVKDKFMKNVDALDIESFKSRRLSEDVEPITVNIQLKHLRAAFHHAVRLKFISENPCNGVANVRMEKQEARSLSEAELRQVLTAIPDLEFRNMVVVTVLTAMRLSEMTYLPWEHVDLKNQVIHIRPYRDFQPKQGHCRTIPLNRWVLEYLEAKERTSEYVFPKPDGTPYKASSISQKFKKYLKRAGMDPRIHWHSLRHTGISFLISKGVPAAYVQRFAGHSSITVTQGYIHVADQALAIAIRALTPPLLN